MEIIIQHIETVVMGRAWRTSYVKITNRIAGRKGYTPDIPKQNKTRRLFERGAF
jgi:hypothetical protein